jgi:hypothetical protein
MSIEVWELVGIVLCLAVGGAAGAILVREIQLWIKRRPR